MHTYKKFRNAPATGSSIHHVFKGKVSTASLPTIGATTVSNFLRPDHAALSGANSKERNAALIGANSTLSKRRNAALSGANSIINNPIVGAAKASDCIGPGNNALLGQVSRVSNSSSDLYHRTSLVWTIDQIKEFVSIDSVTIFYVQNQMGKSISPVCDEDSAVVHVTTY